MPERTRIKMCGITRTEDALEAARLGVDALGFIFYAGSTRYVTAEGAAAIVATLPPFVTTVGLFVDPTEDEVRAVLSVVALDLLQFHGRETPDFCNRFGRPWMKAIAAAPGVDLLQSAGFYAGARALLIDAFVPGAHGGTGVQADWHSIPKEFPMPIVLAGGLHPDNVAEAVRTVRPWAVDVSSGIEQAKGIKAPHKMSAFVRGVRDADA